MARALAEAVDAGFAERQLGKCLRFVVVALAARSTHDDNHHHTLLPVHGLTETIVSFSAKPLAF
jgi:hypothetical protein